MSPPLADLLNASPALRREIIRQVARNDLTALLGLAWPLVSPAGEFVDAPFYRAISFELGRLMRGEDQWLGIAIPPRGGKSILTSVVLPAFLLGRDPTVGVMCVTHSKQLAAKFANDFRRVVSSPLYRAIFPEMRIDPRKDSESETRTTMGGFRLATSIEGVVTGRGAEWIICDDPLQPADAASDAIRERVNEFIARSLSTRANNKRAPKFLMVMQRLHPLDPIGFLNAKGLLRLLSLPARTEVDRRIQLGPNEYHDWRAGELLAPGIWPTAFLEGQKALMGSWAFNAQYLCEPLPAHGKIVQWPWFMFYDVPPSREPRDRVIQSWDMAAKTGEMNDYSVCITVLLRGSRYYVLDIFREKLEYPDLKRKAIELAREHRANIVLVEDTMSGQALIQELRDLNLPDLASPIAVRPERDKVERLKVASPVIEARQVYLPDGAPFLDDFKTELIAFPNGMHDDQVDALTQLINWAEPWRKAHASDGVIGIPVLFRS